MHKILKRLTTPFMLLLSLFTIVAHADSTHIVEPDDKVQASPKAAQQAGSKAVDMQTKANFYGPIASHETLWSVATQLRPSKKYSVQQTLLAIYKLTPQSFENQNIHKLIPGSRLNIPSATQVEAESTAEAIQIMERHKSSSPQQSKPSQSKAPPQQEKVVSEPLTQQKSIEEIDLVAPQPPKLTEKAKIDQGLAKAENRIAALEEENHHLRMNLSELQNEVNNLKMERDEASRLQSEAEAKLKQEREKAANAATEPGPLDALLSNTWLVVLLALIPGLLLVAVIILILTRTKTKQEEKQEEQAAVEETTDENISDTNQDEAKTDSDAADSENTPLPNEPVEQDEAEQNETDTVLNELQEEHTELLDELLQEKESVATASLSREGSAEEAELNSDLKAVEAEDQILSDDDLGEYDEATALVDAMEESTDLSEPPEKMESGLFELSDDELGEYDENSAFVDAFDDASNIPQTEQNAPQDQLEQAEQYKSVEELIAQSEIVGEDDVNPDEEELKLDVGLNEFPDVIGDVEQFDVDANAEASGKLDLAKIYIEMNDSEGAAKLLQEAIVYGDEETRQQANTLLDKINKDKL